MYDKDSGHQVARRDRLRRGRDPHARDRARPVRRRRDLTTLGDAYRNPKDGSQPMIGEEIAAARALIALGTELLQSASSRIEQVTHQPVHLYR